MPTKSRTRADARDLTKRVLTAGVMPVTAAVELLGEGRADSAIDAAVEEQWLTEDSDELRPGAVVPSFKIAVKIRAALLARFIEQAGPDGITYAEGAAAVGLSPSGGFGRVVNAARDAGLVRPVGSGPTSRLLVGTGDRPAEPELITVAPEDRAAAVARAVHARGPLTAEAAAAAIGMKTGRTFRRVLANARAENWISRGCEKPVLYSPTAVEPPKEPTHD